MKSTATNLSVWVDEREKVAWIKVSGRATFTSSVDFKRLIIRLWELGYLSFLLDLSHCLLMDSTFLGVLAGLGLKFGKPGGDRPATIQLLNPNPRIGDLLENLGVAPLFKVLSGPAPVLDQLESLEQPPPSSDRLDLARTSLEAHKTLMQISPANAQKFKDVAEFLAEDLKRIEEQTENKPPGQS